LVDIKKLTFTFFVPLSNYVYAYAVMSTQNKAVPTICICTNVDMFNAFDVKGKSFL